MNNKNSGLSHPYVNYSRSYREKINSCELAIDDLKKLYKTLSEKSTEAANIFLQTSTFPEASDIPEKINALKDKLLVEVWGESNEYMNGDHISFFEDQRLPNKIIRIKFSSTSVYIIATGINFLNNFELQLDFSRCRILDFSKITDPVNQNQSYFQAQGTNATWVDGVYHAITSFFKDKKLKRAWLHSDYAYDAILYLFFFPIIFKFVHALGSIFKLSEKGLPFAIPVYVYLFIVLLYMFRILFNYAKWMFPYVELKDAESKPFKHRLFLGSICIGIIIAASWDLIKIAFKLLMGGE